MAAKAIAAIAAALRANKTDDEDHAIRMIAVKRCGKLLQLAQGTVQEPATVDSAWTWEKLSQLYRK